MLQWLCGQRAIWGWAVLPRSCSAAPARAAHPAHPSPVLTLLYLQVGKLALVSVGCSPTSRPCAFWLWINCVRSCCRMHDKKIKWCACCCEIKCRASPAVPKVSHQPNRVYLPQEKAWTPRCSWLSFLLMSTLHFTWEIWKITKKGQRLGKRVELRQRETTGSSERFILLDLYQLFRPDSRSCSYNSQWQTLQLGSSSEPAWELYHPCPVGCCSLFASQANSD